MRHRSHWFSKREGRQQADDYIIMNPHLFTYSLIHLFTYSLIQTGIQLLLTLHQQLLARGQIEYLLF